MNRIFDTLCRSRKNSNALDRPPGAALPVPGRCLQGRGEQVPERQGSRVVSGRAPQPGRLVLAGFPSPPGQRAWRQAQVPAGVASRCRFAGGGLLRQAQRATEGRHRERIRRNQSLMPKLVPN